MGTGTPTPQTSTAAAEFRHLLDDVLAETDADESAGFALFFHNFSTFLTRKGLYLEDLYVRQAHRGKGYGKQMLAYLAQLAVERGCGRFEWSVLDWNEPAITFYEGLGASILPEWRIVRVTGAALDELATMKASTFDGAS